MIKRVHIPGLVENGAPPEQWETLVFLGGFSFREKDRKLKRPLLLETLKDLSDDYDLFGGKMKKLRNPTRKIVVGYRMRLVA